MGGDIPLLCDKVTLLINFNQECQSQESALSLVLQSKSNQHAAIVLLPIVLSLY